MIPVPIRLSKRIRLVVTLALVAIAAHRLALILRKPPYGASRWEWHIEPKIIGAMWLVLRRCPECGVKRIHKMDCSRG